MKTARLTIVAMVATAFVIGYGNSPAPAQDADEARRDHGASARDLRGQGRRPRRVERRHDRRPLRGQQRHGDRHRRDRRRPRGFAGNVLGAVKHDLALPVTNVASTCNQLRMDLAATDADVLQTLVHFDKEVAGFDSRDGAIPKALGVLCDVGALIGSKPSAATLATALNGVVASIRPKQGQ